MLIKYNVNFMTKFISGLIIRNRFLTRRARCVALLLAWTFNSILES